MNRSFGLASIVLTLALPVVAQMSHHDAPKEISLPEGLGEIHFPTSGAPGAQQDFLKGLLLLHSFEFDAAATAFRQAQTTDPSFALAYWGEAMTRNHPIWGEQDAVAARAILARLGATPAERLAKAPTDREKGYMNAVETLYGTGSKPERDRAYSAAMGDLARRFPEDLDARAFYALSLLGLTGTDRDVSNYMRAAAVAEEVYEINKKHPGALHYLIHSYDDPVHAPLGLRAARLYAEVAKGASHAQHMPSHIFFALGMWEEANSTNIASMKTARDQGMGGYHPLHWLEHGYLQLGNLEEAKKLVAIVEADVAKKPTAGNRLHLAMTRATWLVETRGAGGSAMREPVDSSGIAAFGAFAGLDLARGLAALESGDVKAGQAALADLRKRIEAGHKAPKDDGTSASRYAVVTESELKTAALMEKELDAAVRFAMGKKDEAIDLAKNAVITEDALVFEYGPPAMVKPSSELLGELLLTAGRKEEARAAFEHVLTKYPNRSLSLGGLNRTRPTTASTP